MKRRMIPFGVLGALLVLLAGPVAAADGTAAPHSDLDPGVARSDLPDPDPARDPGPLTIFAEIEEAWAEEDLDRLVDLLDPDGKVRLAFERGGPRGGWFNRDQAYYLLKDMFEFLRTDRFRFERYWNLDANGRSPYAVAVRDFRQSDGVPRTDQVFISLRKRDGAWTVGEIRTVDP